MSQCVSFPRPSACAVLSARTFPVQASTWAPRVCRRLADVESSSSTPLAGLGRVATVVRLRVTRRGHRGRRRGLLAPRLDAHLPTPFPLAVQRLAGQRLARRDPASHAGQSGHRAGRGGAGQGEMVRGTSARVRRGALLEVPGPVVVEAPPSRQPHANRASALSHTPNSMCFSLFMHHPVRGPDGSTILFRHTVVGPLELWRSLIWCGVTRKRRGSRTQPAGVSSWQKRFVVFVVANATVAHCR